MDVLKKFFPSKEEQKSLSIIKDPFNKTCVTTISTHFSESLFDEGVWRYTGRVKFKNGNTKGEQEFDADSPAKIFAEMDAFLKTLE